MDVRRTQLCTLKKSKLWYKVGNVALETVDVFKILGQQRFCSRGRADIAPEGTNAEKRD